MATKKEDKIYISQETFDKYKAEYYDLVNVKRVEVQLALKEARAQGDLSENAEYDAARENQSNVEGRILELESILEKAEVINNEQNETSSKIGIGATVTYEKLDKNSKPIETKVVTIMGIHDSDPLNGKISNESPLAIALSEASLGEEVEVDVPEKYSIKILDVKYK